MKKGGFRRPDWLCRGMAIYAQAATTMISTRYFGAASLA